AAVDRNVDGLGAAAIALSAIRDALDAQAPRNLSGKPQNPLGQLLANATLSFSVTRGPFVMASRPETLVITTPLTGTFEALGSVTSGVSSGAGAIGGAVGNLIGGNVGPAGAAFRRRRAQSESRSPGQHRHHLAAGDRRRQT